MDRVYGGRGALANVTNRGRRVATAPMSLRFEPFETAEQAGGGAWLSPSPSPCFSEGCVTMLRPAGATSPSPTPVLHQIMMQTKDKEALLDEIMRLKRTLHERAFFLQRDKVHATTVRIENRKLECDIKDLEYQGSLESNRTAGGRNVRTQLKVMKLRYEEMRDICDSQHEEIALLRRDVRVSHTRELELERDALAQEIAALHKNVDGLKSIQNRLMCVQKDLATTKERADCLESTNRELECCMQIVNKDLDRTYHDEVKSRQKMLESMSLAKRNAKQLSDLEQQSQSLKASIEQEKQDKSILGKQAEELEEQLDKVEQQLAAKGIVRPRTPNYKEVVSRVGSDLANQANELMEKEAAAREAAAKEAAARAAAAAPPTPEQLKEKEAKEAAERAAKEEAARKALAARAVAAREAAAREAAVKEAAARRAAEEEAAEKEAAAKRAAARQAAAAAKKMAVREAAVAQREAEATLALNEATAAREAAALKAEAMSRELQMSKEEAAAKEAALAADLAAAREAAAREAAAAHAAMAALRAKEIELKENKDEQCQTEESYDAIMRKLKEEALMRLESVNSRASTSKSPPPPSSTKLDARKSRFEAEPRKSRFEAEPRKSRFDAETKKSEPRKSKFMADARKSKFVADARKSKFQAVPPPPPPQQTQRKRVYIAANFAEDTKQISEIRPVPPGVPDPEVVAVDSVTPRPPPNPGSDA